MTPGAYRAPLQPTTRLYRFQPESALNVTTIIRLSILLLLGVFHCMSAHATDYEECPPIEYTASQCAPVHFPSRAKACPKTGCAHLNATPKASLDCFIAGQEVYCEAYPQSNVQAYQYHWSAADTLLFSNWFSSESPLLHGRCNGSPAWVSVTVIAPGGGQDTELVQVACPHSEPGGPIIIVP